MLFWLLCGRWSSQLGDDDWWSGWPPSQGTVLGRGHCEDMRCKDGGYSQGEALMDVGPEGKGGCGAAGWR